MEEQLIKIEANIDNMNPEYYSHLLDRFLQAKANDAWLTPIIMKKGRPGIMLSILCSMTLLDTIRELVFKHTTTIGIRYVAMNRLICNRSFRTIYYKGFQVHIKQSMYNGEVVNESIEFDDIHRISENTGESYKAISQQIWSIYKKCNS